MMKLSHAPLFAAIALGLALAPPTAQAQKPALVRNQDEPGRNPYMQSISDNLSTQYCTPYLCTIYFNPVPVGFRLVITHASARYKLAHTGSGPYVQIAAFGFVNAAAITLPAPVAIGGDYYIASGPVTYFVEPGVPPVLLLSGSPVDNTGMYAFEAAITGYLVPLP